MTERLLAHTGRTDWMDLRTGLLWAWDELFPGQNLERSLIGAAYVPLDVRATGLEWRHDVLPTHYPHVRVSDTVTLGAVSPEPAPAEMCFAMGEAMVQMTVTLNLSSATDLIAYDVVVVAPANYGYDLIARRLCADGYTQSEPSEELLALRGQIVH